jgi:meso-butanediol dehydrogenase/(S,S)-butanediol dehydrogenase/diacetyl reductase
MNEVSGRRALVTGAGSGLGRASALRFARDGYAVGCVDVRADAAAATAGEITAAGGQACAVACDISDEQSVQDGVEEILRQLDGIDVVVNAAGIASVSHTLEVTLDEWRRMLDVNLTGTFLVARATLPALLESKGSMINVASVAALRGWRYMAAYAATKGGIVAFSRSIAVEFGGRGVRVNVVCPGSIATPLAAALTPVRDADPELMRRSPALLDPPSSQPEEIAGTIAYLASAEARFVTGSVVVIDGGVTA